MVPLVAAAAFWIALHLLIAGPLRPALAGRLGEKGFQAVFSILSLIGLVALVLAYRAAPFVPVWEPGRVAVHAAMTLVLVAFLLLVYAVSPSNPTSTAAGVQPAGELPVTGITRITRHPMLWAFTLWAVAHLLANGDLGGILLFGSVLVTALNGMVSIDRKRARRFGATWDAFAARTSRLPFAAILGGRNQLKLGEMSVIRLVMGMVLFAAFLHLHRTLFGVSPLDW
ncbi:MAG TPA: NnrU family protein [Azospirillaceae bacterium]|nr:NnrU family protein [Azospirillaceae bacterium]